tara:strand:+ start:326 stop:730 length:405 start_codon:yes stop_codon:yes gene_type:complete
MDERLSRALQFSNYRQTLHIQKQNLIQRMRNQSTVLHNNGMFIADPTTIAFTKALIDRGYENAIIIDSKEVPIKIENLEEFLVLLLDANFKATNEFYVANEKVRRSRNIKSLLEWEPEQDDEEKEKLAKENAEK